jgi:hypothetical protein
MLARIRAAFASWRRRRYLDRHPEPHRNPMIPRKRGLADPTGVAAFMPPPANRHPHGGRPRPRRPDRDDAPPPSGGMLMPARWARTARRRPPTRVARPLTT